MLKYLLILISLVVIFANDLIVLIETVKVFVQLFNVGFAVNKIVICIVFKQVTLIPIYISTSQES